MSEITQALRPIYEKLRGLAPRSANLAAFTSAGATVGQVPTADGKGAVRWAAPSAASAATPFVNLRVDGTASLSNGTVTDVPWAWTFEAPAGFHSDTQDPHIVTIPAGRGGLYFVKVLLPIPDAATGDKSIIVRAPDGSVEYINDELPPDSKALAASDVLRLADGAKVTVSVWNATGATLTVQGGRSYLRLVRLGA